MRILLINDSAAPTGGAEIRTLNLRKGLRERGHDARVFASGVGTATCASRAEYACLGTSSRLQIPLQTANPSAYCRLRRVLHEFRPDVVHVRMFLTQLSPLILPLLRDVPCLYHAVMYESICPTGIKLLPDGTRCSAAAGTVCLRQGCVGLRAWLPLMVKLRLWQRWRDAFNLIVANSEAGRRQLTAAGIEPVEVIWNGVPERAPRPPLAGPPTAVYAGRLAPEKGVPVLVRAFARARERVPKARLVLIGDGPERGRLEALVRDLGLGGSVVFTGHLTRAEMERRCDQAWVQAVPSLWDEPFGNVALEALMRGTAVVASDAGGLAEIVDPGETGFRVPPGDADALAEALCRVVADRGLAERMGRAGHAVARTRFSEATFIDRFIALYQRLAGEKTHVHDRSLRGCKHQSAECGSPGA